MLAVRGIALNGNSRGHVPERHLLTFLGVPRSKKLTKEMIEVDRRKPHPLSNVFLVIKEVGTQAASTALTASLIVRRQRCYWLARGE